ncbi:MAG: diguanylate cyclase [Polyangiaceae bacterium]
MFPQFSTSPPRAESNARVLVAVSALDQVERLKATVTLLGHECLAIDDVDDVFRVVAEWEPDLILLGVDLNGLSGLEVCSELRTSDMQRATPIVLVGDTEDTDEGLVAGGLLAGADDFISRPQRESELKARIQVQLRNKRFRDALRRLRRERDHLRRTAEIDPLTGLHNRRTLESALHAYYEGCERFAILFLDVDHFKAINDSKGHDVGDEVLRGVSRTLKEGIRPGDALGRYGGEEFMVVVAGAGQESARLVAERHRRSVSTLDVSRYGLEQVTISVGVAIYDARRDEETLDELIKRADEALYDAKRSGRNRTVVAPRESAASLGRSQTVLKVLPPTHPAVSAGWPSLFPVTGGRR